MRLNNNISRRKFQHNFSEPRIFGKLSEYEAHCMNEARVSPTHQEIFLTSGSNRNVLKTFNSISCKCESFGGALLFMRLPTALWKKQTFVIDNKKYAKKIQEFNSIQSHLIFRKLWARKICVKTFDVKYCCWVSYYKKKISIKKKN